MYKAIIMQQVAYEISKKFKTRQEAEEYGKSYAEKHSKGDGSAATRLSVDLCLFECPEADFEFGWVEELED